MCKYDVLDDIFYENSLERDVYFTQREEQGMIEAELDETDEDEIERTMGTLKHLIEKTNSLLKQVL